MGGDPILPLHARGRGARATAIGGQPRNRSTRGETADVGPGGGLQATAKRLREEVETGSAGRTTGPHGTHPGRCAHYAQCAHTPGLPRGAARARFPHKHRNAKLKRVHVRFSFYSQGDDARLAELETGRRPSRWLSMFRVNGERLKFGVTKLCPRTGGSSLLAGGWGRSSRTRLQSQPTFPQAPGSRPQHPRVAAAHNSQATRPLSVATPRRWVQSDCHSTTTPSQHHHAITARCAIERTAITATLSPYHRSTATAA